MSLDLVDAFADELTAAGAQVEMVRFPSGAVHMTILRGRDQVVLQGAGDEWGCSMNWPAAEALMGHDHVSATAEESFAIARALLSLNTTG